MTKNKLLIVSPLPPPYGGIARWTEQLIAFLNEKNNIDFKHLDIAVRWRSVHVGIWGRLFGGVLQLFYNYFYFISFLIKGSNIVHLTSSGSFGLVRDFLFLFTSKLFGAKFVIHIRFGRIPDIFLSKNYEYFLLKLIFKFTDNIICIDQKTYVFLSDYSDFLAKKLTLIPNCIDYPFEEKIIKNSNKENIISFVGWVKREKGVEELISSFISLNLESWELKLIGPIDQNFFEKLDKKYALSKNKDIHFLGNLDNDAVLLELKKSKIFALPSYTEGFPNVVLEAMATKNSIVATKVGAIPEMLENEAGILVEVANETDLCVALKTLSQDDSLQHLLSENAFKRCAEVYSIKTVVDQYLGIWKSLERK
ncbi:MAG: glycosyltransferase family 4 protein [Bacilli bacterium]